MNAVNAKLVTMVFMASCVSILVQRTVLIQPKAFARVVASAMNAKMDGMAKIALQSVRQDAPRA